MRFGEFAMPYRSASATYLRQASELQENERQLAAYDSTGHCVVLAGPGSGKTKTPVVKLARVLAEDVQAPKGVACITCSHECAKELKRRLEQRFLPSASANAVWTSCRIARVISYQGGFAARI